MKQLSLRDMIIEQLVEQFTTLALEQDHAALRSDIGRVNRLYDSLKAVADELRGRQGDQRRQLMRLYQHENPHVRLTAVKATLAVAPETALAALKKIAESGIFPQAGEAGMSVLGLERGWYKPS